MLEILAELGVATTVSISTVRVFGPGSVANALLSAPPVRRRSTWSTTTSAAASIEAPAAIAAS